MRFRDLETCRTKYFFCTLKDQGSRSPNPHNESTVLYLKCWGSDYPYLYGAEQPKRWLPFVVESAPSKTVPRRNKEEADRVIDAVYPRGAEVR